MKSARAALTGKEVKAFPFHKEVLAKCKSFKRMKAMPSVMRMSASPAERERRAKYSKC
ncbi:MAG: hypothetical protein VB018_05960 [Lachnospiraceae bacterium]|nr:hypothetical protein [Lachnospiraceae bacterium]